MPLRGRARRAGLPNPFRLGGDHAFLSYSYKIGLGVSLAPHGVAFVRSFAIAKRCPIRSLPFYIAVIFVLSTNCKLRAVRPIALFFQFAERSAVAYLHIGTNAHCLQRAPHANRYPYRHHCSDEQPLAHRQPCDGADAERTPDAHAGASPADAPAHPRTCSGRGARRFPLRLFLVRVRGLSPHEALVTIGYPAVVMTPFLTLGEGTGVSVTKAFRSGTPQGIAFGAMGLAVTIVFIAAWLRVLINVLPRRRLALGPNPEHDEASHEHIGREGHCLGDDLQSLP